jgi:ribonuclease HI
LCDTNFSPMKKCVAYIDGGSRGNPGIAGYGIAVLNEAGQTIASLSETLGVRTNNFAEYAALIGALEYAKSHGYDGITIFADSELLVKQIQGTYKVRSLDLKPLYDRAKTLISNLKFFSVQHVPREQNREADRLANLAMDRGIQQPSPNPASPAPRQVLAVYQAGCFQPLEPAEFEENARYCLTITPADGGAET